MSFILDALKKSEQDRERQQTPRVMEVAYGRRSRAQPVWMLAVIGLLLLNCVLLLVMWWRSGTAPPVAAPVATSTATNTAAMSSVAAMASKPEQVITPGRPAEVRPLLDEAINETEVLDETTTALANTELPAGPSLIRPATGLEQAMAQQQALATNLKANSLNNNYGSNNIGNAAGSLTDNTPTLDSLGGNGALNLPELRLDVHVYSSVATERFAFINMHKYAEGQNLSEGPHLEKITQDGVILSYRNQRFLLPHR